MRAVARPRRQAPEACGDALVAAAAVLGENQFQEEEPGSWSAAGCALAISGRDLPRRPRRSPTRIGRRQRVRLPVPTILHRRGLTANHADASASSRRPLPPSRTPQVAPAAFLRGGGGPSRRGRRGAPGGGEMRWRMRSRAVEIDRTGARGVAGQSIVRGARARCCRKIRCAPGTGPRERRNQFCE